MSTDLLSQLLLSAGIAESQELWLDAIIRRQVAGATASIPEFAASGCLLVDMGNFLLRATFLLSRVARGLVNGDHVDIYVNTKIQEMENYDDFSDLSPLDDLNKKHSLLKYCSSPVSCVRTNLMAAEVHYIFVAGYRRRDQGEVAYEL